MNKRFPLLRGRPSGQSMVDFAWVSFAFFVLLFGIVQMGIAVYRYNTVCEAAREAARYAIVHSPNSVNNPCPATGSCPGAQTVATNFAPFLSSTNVTTSFV